MIRSLISFLLMSALALAQSPPPMYGPTAPLPAMFVGGRLFSQSATDNLGQIANAAAELSAIRPPFFADPASENRVAIGNTLSFLGTTFSNTTVGVNYLPIVAIYTYGVIPLQSVTWTPVPFPGAVPGHDMLFLDQNAAIITYPQWVYPILPPFNQIFALTIDIPNTISLSGMLISSQWGRVDPVNGGIYLSNEHHVRLTN